MENMDVVDVDVTSTIAVIIVVPSLTGSVTSKVEVAIVGKVKRNGLPLIPSGPHVTIGKVDEEIRVMHVCGPL